MYKLIDKKLTKESKEYEPVFFLKDSEGDEFQVTPEQAWFDINQNRVFEGEVFDGKVWIKLN